MKVRHFRVIYSNSGVCPLTSDTVAYTSLRRRVNFTISPGGLSMVALQVLNSLPFFGTQR